VYTRGVHREYKELLEVVAGVRATAPVIEMWTVTGSYRLF
jgi:hypothetical protein